MISLQKKLLLFTTHPSSISLFRIPLIQELYASGYEIHIASSSCPTGLTRDFSFDYFFHYLPLSEFSFSPVSILNELFGLRALALSLGIDTVVSYFLKGSILCGFLSLLLPRINSFIIIEGMGRIFSKTCTFSLYNNCARSYLFFLLRLSLPHVFHSFFLNAHDLSLISSKARLNPTSVSLLGPIGTSICKHTRHKTSHVPIARNILYVGRLLPEKGISLFLRAALDLNALGCTGLCFQICGDPPSNIPPDFLELFKECEDVTNIHFLGYVDPAPLLHSAHLLIHPSIYGEGFPMVIQEAFSFGVPVATSFDPQYNIPGYTDSIYSLQRFPTARSIVNAVVCSLHDVERHEKMRKNAIDVSSRFFNASINSKFIVSKMLDLAPCPG